MRMKYVLSSGRKGNTNNSMEKNGDVKFTTVHIADLFNSENPIHKLLIKYVLPAKVTA